MFQRKQFIDDLDDWIIVPKRIREHITTELIWDEDFARMFNFKHKKLLNQLFFLELSFDEEDICELTNSCQELYL